jgi:hypothetical protein
VLRPLVGASQHVPNDRNLPVLEAFADGSYLSQITAATDRRHGVAPTVVRVLEYRLDDPGRPKAKGQVYRLLTTILDPNAAPAAELAALYHQRCPKAQLTRPVSPHRQPLTQRYCA